MTDRYVVIKKTDERYVRYYILDDEKNKIVSEPFMSKEQADKVCRKVNREMKNADKRRT